jgi:hypothetical protein
MRRFGGLRLAVVVAVMAALAGCGEDNKVGDESLLNFKEQAGERLGETTTTTAPPTTTTTAPPTQATRPGGGAQNPTPTTATTRPPATATTATTATTAPRAQVVTLEIAINSDNVADPPLDPQAARVFVGSIVRWVNRDSVPRSVESVDRKTFRSPPIPPGGSFDYRATTPGLFDYGDGTRPYVNGSLEVLEK